MLELFRSTIKYNTRSRLQIWQVSGSWNNGWCECIASQVLVADKLRFVSGAGNITCVSSATKESGRLGDGGDNSAVWLLAGVLSGKIII